MPSAQELLTAAGVEVEPGLEPPGLRSDGARLAAAVRRQGIRLLGLAPGSDDAAVAGPAMVLGRALADASPGTVAVVDALGGWPCARALAEHAVADASPVAWNWVRERLAVVTPRAPGGAQALRGLRSAFPDLLAAFDHVIVDMSGLDRLGEHLAAYQILDGVVLVARRGRTTTRQVRIALRDVPDGLALGVLLTGV